MSNILERIYQCEFCHKLDAAYLECDHFSCKDCLVLHTKELSLTQRLSDLHCPACNSKLASPFTHAFILSPDHLKTFIKSLKICEYCNKTQEDLIITKEKTLICYSCLSTYDEPKAQPHHPGKKQEKKKEESPKNIKFNENIKKNENIPKKVPEPSPKPAKVAIKPLCFQCKVYESANTACTHSYCLKCLNKVARKALIKDPFSLVCCDKCQNTIPDSIISSSFESFSSYENFKNTCANALFNTVPSFDCGICMNKTPVDSGITFECDHRFCIDCVKEYFRERIMSSNVAEDELVCPSCNLAIDHNIIQGVVERDLYEKYVNFAFRNWKPDEGNILKYCHFCEAAAEIPRDLKRFVCPKCKKKYCPQCNQDHSEKITCEEHVRILENKEQEKNREEKKLKEKKVKEDEEIVLPEQKKRPNRAEEEKKHQKKGEDRKKREQNAKVNDELFVENLKKESKACPKCKNFVFRDSGCNFIKCRWPGCKDSYFCYLCGASLTINHHYSHYKISGPFGKTCNKLDGIKDPKY